jgi:hypothetical protein
VILQTGIYCLWDFHGSPPVVRMFWGKSWVCAGRVVALTHYFTMLQISQDILALGQITTQWPGILNEVAQ